MSQSTPICSLFCSKCKAESRRSLRHYDRDHHRFYLDVIVLSTVRGGNAALCKCKRCGHTYISNSMAAKRALRRLSNGDYDECPPTHFSAAAVECEESVILKIRQRRDVGRCKYGMSMERTDLTKLDWLRHAQEEAMDFAIYLEKLIQTEQQRQS